MLNRIFKNKKKGELQPFRNSIIYLFLRNPKKPVLYAIIMGLKLSSTHKSTSLVIHIFLKIKEEVDVKAI